MNLIYVFRVNHNRQIRTAKVVADTLNSAWLKVVEQACRTGPFELSAVSFVKTMPLPEDVAEFLSEFYVES